MSPASNAADSPCSCPTVILIYAHIDGSTPEGDAYARWVTRTATGPEPFALSVLVLSGFVRIVTNARVFDPLSTVDEAFAFVSSLKSSQRVAPWPGRLHLSLPSCPASLVVRFPGGSATAGRCSHDQAGCETAGPLRAPSRLDCRRRESHHQPAQEV